MNRLHGPLECNSVINAYRKDNTHNNLLLQLQKRHTAFYIQLVQKGLP